MALYGQLVPQVVLIGIVHFVFVQIVLKIFVLKPEKYFRYHSKFISTNLRMKALTIIACLKVFIDRNEFIILKILEPFEKNNIFKNLFQNLLFYRTVLEFGNSKNGTVELLA